MPSKILMKATQVAMDKNLEALQQDFKHVRASGASVMMLDAVFVDSYGQMVPLNQVATVSVADPRTLLVTPFDRSDKNVLKNIEKGIINANLDLNPQNDGIVVRLNVPALTEEKRKELVKKAKEFLEKAKVKLRGSRQEALDALKKGKKDGIFSEDEVKRLEKDVQKITDEIVKKMDELFKAKEKELMTI